MNRCNRLEKIFQELEDARMQMLTKANLAIKATKADEKNKLIYEIKELLKD